MDTQQLKSIELLQKYLAESSLQERDEIWARVESMGIQGPSVDEYFQNLEDELNSFESSFIGRLAIDSVKGIYGQRQVNRIMVWRHERANTSCSDKTAIPAGFGVPL